MRTVKMKDLASTLGMQKEIDEMNNQRRVAKEKARKARLERFVKESVYRLTNYLLPDFEVFSAKGVTMEEAIEFFKKHYPIEYVGSSVNQVKGINPKNGANFAMNANWATQEEYDAFVSKYSFEPKWTIMSKEEQEREMELEYQRDLRKGYYD